MSYTKKEKRAVGKSEGARRQGERERERDRETERQREGGSVEMRRE